MNISSITRFFRGIRTAKIRRFELLLPTTYNDGSDIERAKFEQTTKELSDRFSGLTQELVQLHGIWRFAGKLFEDKLLRIRVDSGDSTAVAFLKSYKQVLKARFDQLDIWITAHEIEVV
jgi:hypothetical protein